MKRLQLNNGEKLLLSKSSIWFLKIVFLLSLLTTTFLFIHIKKIFRGTFYQNIDIQLENALNKMNSFTEIYHSVGINVFITLFVFAFIFLIFWLFTVEGSYKSLPSAIRDILTVYFFTVLISMFYNSTNDYMNTVTALSIYLVVGIANFGGINEIGKTTFKNLFKVAIIIGVSNFLSYIFKFNSNYSISFYFLDLAMVYIMSFLLKIFFYPEEILTFDINTGNPKYFEIKRVGFAFLSILLLFPFVAVCFGVLEFLFAWIISIFSTPDFSKQDNWTIYTIFAPATFPGYYVIYLLKTNVLGFIFFLISLAVNLQSFADEEITIDNSFDEWEYNNRLFKWLAELPISKDETITKPFLILGLSSICINIFITLDYW